MRPSEQRSLVQAALVCIWVALAGLIALGCIIGGIAGALLAGGGAM